jgi:hypothetical protein
MNNISSNYKSTPLTHHLLANANVVPSSPFLFTLIMEVIHSSETLFLTIAIQRHIPEDGILHSLNISVRRSVTLVSL